MVTPLIPAHPHLSCVFLDNGLVSRVIPHGKPAGMVELRLVVRAGSVLEDGDQLGVAHVLEHLAFRGSDQFPDDGLVRALAAYGNRFGAHLNATTSFETTIYKLQLPVEALELGITVLHEWAAGLALPSDAIEAERLVVLEEWRRGRGPGARARDVLHPLAFGGSPYEERLPIGTRASIENFEHDVVHRFYRDWYRPDLMGVLVVGDVDADVVHAMVAARFSHLSSPSTPRARTETEISVPNQPRVATFTDPESVQTEVALTAQLVVHESSTEEGYTQQHLLPGLVERILQERLLELSQLSTPPYIHAQVRRGRIAPGLVHHAVAARAHTGRAEEALTTLAQELARLGDGDMSPGALDRARRRLIRDLRKLEVEAEHLPSARLVNELVRHHTVGEPMPGAAIERQLAERLLLDIDQETVEAACRGWFPEEGRILTVVGPEKAVIPDDATVLAHVSDVPSPEERLTEADMPTRLMSQVPTPGRVVEEETWPELGLTRWTLSNGCRVWMKPTTFREDDVLFQLQAMGGTSLADDDDFVAARTAVSIATRSGMGEFSAAQLSRFLAGRTVALSPMVKEHWHGLRGASSVEDLSTLLDLAWMRINQSRFDPVAFDNERANRLDGLTHRKANPSAVFRGRFKRNLWCNHRRIQPWKIKHLDEMDNDRSKAFFSTCMTSLAQGDMILIGSFEPEAVRQIVCERIGALTSGMDEVNWRDRGRRSRTTPSRLEVRRGQTPRATVQLRYGGAYEDTPGKRYALRVMGGVLSLMLRAELREVRGGTYNVSVRIATVQIPTHFWAVTLTFECDPSRTEELIVAAQKTVTRLRDGGIPEHFVSEVRAQHQRSWEQRILNNGYWLDAIALCCRRGESPLEILQHPKRVAAITKAGIEDTAQRHMTDPPLLVGVLLPEEDSSPTE